jgi:hypothetical protein
MLGMLGEFPVQPWNFEGRAFVALCILAALAACLDFRELLTCLDEFHPRLRALSMACRIATAPLVACMHFLHLAVHLVLPLSRKVMTMEHLRALVMALKISWLARAVARVSFLDHWAFLFRNHGNFHRMLGKLLVHPV